MLIFMFMVSMRIAIIIISWSVSDRVPSLILYSYYTIISLSNRWEFWNFSFHALALHYQLRHHMKQNDEIQLKYNVLYFVTLLAMICRFLIIFFRVNQPILIESVKRQYIFLSSVKTCLYMYEVKCSYRILICLIR